MIATSLVGTAERLLCKGAYAGASCKPIRWSPQGKRNRGTLEELVASGLGATMLESGFREDVQTGRGRHKHPVDLGEGRGPANETGLMQVMVGMACVFAPGLTDSERIECRRTKENAEANALRLVGGEEAVGRAFETGLRMLAKSRNHCEWELSRDKPVPNWREPSESWIFRMYQYYGTGKCIGGNSGKTAARFRTYLMLRGGYHVIPKRFMDYLVYRGIVPKEQP
jgi:hypothetical protein